MATTIYNIYNPFFQTMLNINKKILKKYNTISKILLTIPVLIVSTFNVFWRQFACSLFSKSKKKPISKTYHNP